MGRCGRHVAAEPRVAGFFGLQIATGSRLGAIVMGIGVMLGVVTMILRLLPGERIAAEAA